METTQFKTIHGCRLFVVMTGCILLTSCASCPTSEEVAERLKQLQERVRVLESHLDESEQDLESCLTLLEECNAICPNN